VKAGKVEKIKEKIPEFETLKLVKFGKVYPTVVLFRITKG
jgi:hypothetical protein